MRPGALSALLAEVVRAAPDRADASELLVPGCILDRFELVREIGRGGFGVVWEAKDRELGRTVALKALGAVTPNVRDDRLLREAEAAARLTHPNIVTLFDVGSVDGAPYLVLEFLRGASLATRLAQGPMPLGEALRIAVEVAKGLAHAHANGVVHRDLTPGNVFLCEDGQVKILDFGMAHAFGRRRIDGGTPGYMAPEQVERAPEDERTDVFALGVLLYRMLSGRVPYPVEGDGRWKRPPELDVEGHPALGPLVQRMLASRPTDRPRDAGEVLAALSAFEKELARSGGSGGRVRRRWRAGARLAVLTVLGVALGVVLVTGALKWQAGRRSAPQATPSIAVLPFADLSPQRDQEYFADGLAEEVLNGLARIDGLRVPARTSSFWFKGKDVALAEVGRKLNVTHVLEGSVRKSGQRVRVAAQLVDVTDGYHVWSETLEGDVTDVFALEDKLTSAVVGALKLKLLPQRTAAGTPPPDARAYEEFLVGRHLFYRNGHADVPLATSHFERAVALDPRYAPAWGFLAIAIGQRAWWAGRVTADERRRAMDAAERAIALAPADAVGYVARGFLRNVLAWDWAGAQADIETALSCVRGYVNPENQQALLYAALGRVREAVAAERNATERDPLNGIHWSNLALFHMAVGDLELARAAATRAMELSTPERLAFRLGMIELIGGSPTAALEHFGRSSWEAYRLGGAAMATHDLGRAEESRHALETLIARHAADEPVAIAEVFAWRGERDHAFEWLERAHAERPLSLSELKYGPLYRGLRSDPRYAALLRKMNLPPD